MTGLVNYRDHSNVLITITFRDIPAIIIEVFPSVMIGLFNFPLFYLQVAFIESIYHFYHHCFSDISCTRGRKHSLQMILKIVDYPSPFCFVTSIMNAWLGHYLLQSCFSTEISKHGMWAGGSLPLPIIAKKNFIKNFRQFSGYKMFTIFFLLLQ